MFNLINKFFQNYRNIIDRICAYSIFYVLYPILFFIPIKRNKVVVSNFWGRSYGDNPKYICNYLLSTNWDIDIVWLCNKDIINLNKDDFPKGIRLVKNRSFQALLELHTAKIWIDDCRKSFYPKKRKQQFYLQTWHAGFGLKRIEHDTEQNLTPRYIKMAKKDSKMCDLLIFEHSKLFKNIGKTFWYDGEIFRDGIPKNDIIVKPTTDIIEKVHNFYNIAKDKKIILYAPTFRVDYDLKINPLFLERIIETANLYFHEKYVLILRLHPNDKYLKDKILNSINNSDILDGSVYNDMQELLSTCNMLITDYSSTIGEMLVANKKCFIYAYDYEEYMEDQGLVMELTELPFPVTKTENELLESIKNFNSIKYENRLSNFKKKWDIYESGQASKELGDRLLQEMQQYKEN
ncbi:CDP-glycerol glycerophosphotransferase family protein [Melissococcus plutonius]|uniref:CDP-glycerol glycerophosphotransferase n=1 Tax=Melissococcus plutonius (strain ATCC 35311 / DSM 29964 / CIP 104052 / LMG 20360 / NCIMB 702443) TaxID=940190 RepID=F3Y9V9_MELPT|nr:CDP-glycerol glycerophosphotransferase family protein [Melissococcus plutonius]BAK21287.1 CDP-glycerol glycerophosphotransferase [Melissococcus plutonius ATCC 35311]AIM24815.1 CDP-glycerol/poly(glycerophosphate) glycerophosphotransferase TagF [Melissococcus plutonius S1]KMT24935.1 CDP-glycerol/poly(glycerophosphate) glycerophosphotransferase TagF [Melissococcus plutonius]KMT26572.1 CDP-glycerol/poly(glycerophosphate) glycerophosphotransferase TagF [Melissococcus plutonius]KMT27822.1 CDP-gly